MNKRLLAIMGHIFDRILDLTALLSGALIIFLIISVCWDVGLRFFFNKPTTWVTEFGSYIMLWAPFLVAAYVLRAGRHVTMDMVLVALSPRGQFTINVITTSLAVIVSAIITFFGFRVVAELYQSGERTETFLMIIKWPIMGIIPLSTFFLLIESLRRLCRLLATRSVNGNINVLSEES